MPLQSTRLYLALAAVLLRSAFPMAAASDTSGPGGVDPAHLGPGDRPPVVKFQARPTYPFSLRRSGKKGEVLVDFIVDPQGNVVRALVVRASHPDFESPAVEAVLKWKFDPALKAGHPVFTHMQVPILFALNSTDSRFPFDHGVDVWHVPEHAPKGVPPDFNYDDPPQPQLTNAPVYPFDLITAKVRGNAHVLFAVDPHGHSHIVKVVDCTQPEFGQAAAAMLQSWEFTPARKAGLPCWAIFQKQVTFDVDDLEFPVNDSAVRLLDDLKKRPCPVVSSTRELDAPPRGRFQPSPVLPDSVVKAATPAQAMISFIIDYTGHAQLPRVRSASTDDFGWAAATAVARWQFTSPLLKGRPVDVQATVPVVWNPPAAPARAD